MKSKKLELSDFHETTGKYYPKTLCILIEGLNKLIDNADTVDKQYILNSIIKIAKRGSNANVWIAIGYEEDNEHEIFDKKDLNNFAVKIVTDKFDKKLSDKVFIEDLSQESMPELTGRGFMKYHTNLKLMHKYFDKVEIIQIGQISDKLFKGDSNHIKEIIDNYKIDKPTIDEKSINDYKKEVEKVQKKIHKLPKRIMNRSNIGG